MSDHTHTCTHCGGGFTPDMPQKASRKTCSPECARAARRERERGYVPKAHPKPASARRAPAPRAGRLTDEELQEMRAQLERQCAAPDVRRSRGGHRPISLRKVS